jgi:hypothetical protein
LQDALQSFEAIMDGSPEHQSGFNLVVCYFALGDREKMKRAFSRLLAIKKYEVDADEDLDAAAEAALPVSGHVLLRTVCLDTWHAVGKCSRVASNRLGGHVAYDSDAAQEGVSRRTVSEQFHKTGRWKFCVRLRILAEARNLLNLPIEDCKG